MTKQILFTPGHCAVCGETPTVKSHIIPRALALDLRGKQKHLVSGELDRPGIKYLQNGRWDPHLLCRDHEGRLSHIDDYGISFIRRFCEVSDQSTRQHAIPIANDRPHLLQAFFLALIWKKNLSNRGKGRPCELGPYASAIRNVLFSGHVFPSPLFLVQNPTAVDGQRIPIAVEPYRVKMRDTNAWKCDLGWLSAVVTLDKRGWPQEWLQFDATSQDPAPVITLDRAQPSLAPILQNMRSTFLKLNGRS